MDRNDMTNYMLTEMWVDRVQDCISTWEKTQGIEVTEEIRESVVKFMHTKIKRGIKKSTLTKMFMQIAVTALLYIKMKKGDT